MLLRAASRARPARRLLSSSAPSSSSSARPAVTMFSEEERLLRDSVARFAAERVAPKADEMDRDSRMCPDIVREMFESGLMGIEVPEKYGGAGMNFVSTAVAVEELAAADPAVALVADIQNTLAVTAFMRYGSEEQKEEYLPRLARDTIVSFCLSEAGAGSDAFSLRTAARHDPERGTYTITGNKMWISHADVAGAFVVFANSAPEKRHRGITAFVVDAGAKGVRVGKKEDKLGLRASATCEVEFDGVEVPESAVLGRVGKGYKIAIELLNEGRIGVGAQMVGIARGTFDRTVPYLMQREQFGQPLFKFQGLRWEVARARAEMEAARVLVYNAARLREAGAPYIMEASICKLVSSEMAEKVASSCLRWMGGVGFTMESPQQRFLRASYIGQTYEGTSAMQLNTIAALVEEESGARQ